MTGHHGQAMDTSAVGLAVMALVMAVMMAPFLGEPLVLVRQRSFRRVRLAAVAEFSFTYLAAWFVIALGLLAVLRPTARLWNPFLTFAAACVVLAVWQFTDTRSTIAARCRRLPCPPASGWRSHLGTAAEGAQEAASCVRTSGGPMLLMALAPVTALMVLAWAIHLWEWRPSHDPFADARAVGPAAAYAVLAVATVLVFVLG